MEQEVSLTNKQFEELFEQNFKSLNQEQLLVTSKIVDSIKEKSPQKLFFVNGSAGTGKTFIYNTLAYFLEAHEQVFVTSAVTGIASLLLHKGTTMHSALKLPIECEKGSYLNIEKNTNVGARMKALKLIVIDEASMMTVQQLLCIDRSLRELRNSCESFGGVVMVLGGDMKQCLPVMKHCSEA